MNGMHFGSFLGLTVIATLLFTHSPCMARSITDITGSQTVHVQMDETYQLRGYRGIRHTVEQLGQLGAPVTLHRFLLDDVQHAEWFVSKIYSDFALTFDNAIRTLPTPQGPVDAIDLNGRGIIAPVILADSREVDVVVGDSVDAVIQQVIVLTEAVPMRQSNLTHPLYMDKWDRYCLGVWQKLGDYSRDKRGITVDAFYKWMGAMGLNPQINIPVTADLVTSDAPFTWLRHYFDKYDVKYQHVEWLANSLDTYNRNPFLTKTINPHVTTRWSYYGEVRDATGPLKNAQIANFLLELKRQSSDPHQMALLDPDGEIGPIGFDSSWWGPSGPTSQRQYVRFLREVRKLSLDDVSLRYYGQPGIYKSWEDVTLPDWRTFYGWTDGSIDLAGEWRFMRDGKLEGYSGSWALPSFDDNDWVRLYYPGDALVYGLVTPADQSLWERKTVTGPLWMRKTVTVPATAFPGKVYLSAIPLSRESVQVFVNGQVLGILEPRYRGTWTFGQFDITDYLAKSHTLTITLRLTSGDAPNGPIFLTSKPIEGNFPTSDSFINARRWDTMEYVDWTTAQSVGTALRAIRTVDADRPIKVHAYGESPWGWQTVAQYGGFSHHTGSGPSASFPEPHQFGLSRDLQDSSETAGPVNNLRDLKGLFGNLIFMGKNAFDYFINLESIVGDPQMLAYFEQKIPDIKMMGRANALMSPIAEIKGYLNWQYLGETSHWDSWRYDVNPVRGGEMIPFLDEIRIHEGNLNRFAAIIDPGTQCWEDEETAALRAYVEAGGVLMLNCLSGQDSFMRRGDGTGPGATLAGVRLGPSPGDDSTITFISSKSILPGMTGTVRIDSRYGISSHSLILQKGTEVIGTWADGSPAFTRRDLGKGTIYDCGGARYPSEVMTALATAYGPKMFATVENGGGVDLVRTLRSNNGCEDLLMMRGLGNKAAVVHWTFDYVPKSIYNPVTGKPIAAQIDGNTATFTVNIPDWDFSWFAALRPNAADAFSHWFTRQTQMWSGYAKPGKAPEVPLFRHLDLNHGWKLAQTDSVDHAKALMAQDDQADGLIPTELLPWNTPGMNVKTGPDVVRLYRKDFDLPAAWVKESILKLVIRGQINEFPVPGWEGKSAIYLNGSPIWNGDRLDSVSLDVTTLLQPVHNRMEIIYQGNGIMSSIMLERSAKPDFIMDLAGTWLAVDGLQQEREVTLPGAIKTAFVYRDINVPVSTIGQDVWIRVDGNCSFVVVNGRVRYWDMGNDSQSDIYMKSPGCEINISPDIRTGRINRIALGTRAMFNGWSPQDLNYHHIELAIYRPGSWSIDGKSNRAALTPTELEHVAQDLGTVQLYPMIHSTLSNKAALSLSTVVHPVALPPSIVDLDLHSPDAVISDRSPNHIPLTISGIVQPFSEAGGVIAGVYLRGEKTSSGGLAMPPTIFRKLMKSGDFTIRTWIKPMYKNGTNGSIVNWREDFDWKLSDDSSITLTHPLSRKMTVNNAIVHRVWQSLTLVIHGSRAQLYLNGVLVAMQTLDKPVAPPSSDVIVGNNPRELQDPIDIKMSAFTIYEGTLTAEQIVAQYNQEKAHFALDTASSWPENDVFRLSNVGAAPHDAAEIPAQIEMGSGVHLVRESGDPYLSFNGEKSYLLLHANPRVGHLSEPFSMVLEMRREPGASGMIFRHFHSLCLQLTKEGTLIFDANIGHHNAITFPNVVPEDKWVRLMLTYDGKTARIFRDGTLMGEQDYPGNLYNMNPDFPMSVFVDNTTGHFDYGIRGALRELRIIPSILPTMPPPTQNP